MRVASDERQHASEVLDLVDGVLAESGVALGELAGFAVAIGPGSFTRLRVGLATIKGLAFGSATPVAAVSTLEAMAEAASESLGRDRPIAPALDARRGELYAALFEAAPEEPTGWRARVAESVARPGEWRERMPADAVWVGEGAALMAESAPGPEPAAQPTGPIHPELGAPDAAAVGVVGTRLLAAGRGMAAAALVPRYLRRAEAEATRLGDPLEPL